MPSSTRARSGLSLYAATFPRVPTSSCAVKANQVSRAAPPPEASALRRSLPYRQGLCLKMPSQTRQLHVKRDHRPGQPVRPALPCPDINIYRRPWERSFSRPCPKMKALMPIKPECGHDQHALSYDNTAVYPADKSNQISSSSCL